MSRVRQERGRASQQSGSRRTGTTSTMRRRTQRDSSGSGFLVLMASVVVLNLVGLVMVLSASSVTALYEYGSSFHFFLRQAVWVAAGFIALAVATRVDYHQWRRLAIPLVAVTAVLLVAVLVVGREVNGAQRWLGTDYMSIQPSEFAKLALILFTADLLARRADKMDRTAVTLRPVLIVLTLFAALVILQPNLGTMLLMAAIVFGMLFVAGTPFRSLGGLLGLASVGAVALAMAAPYRRDRMLAVLDPWSDPLNTGYQTIQSMVGIASGGLTGVGLGASRAKWGFLPFAHTDFIFAIIAEELGLLGAGVVILLFAALALIGLRAAIDAPDTFGRLLAAGITTWLVVQAVINIGSVVGVMPITGVPLPFVSFGGSSLVVTMVATGLLLNIARHGRPR